MARATVVKGYLKNKKTVVPVSDEKIEKEEESKDPNSELKKTFGTGIAIGKANVKWDDIAGLEKVKDVLKDVLKEALILPYKFPQLYADHIYIRPWRGILLYGPPGTGKRFLAEACAAEVQVTLFLMKSSDLMTKLFDESERLIRSLFEMARASAPAVIFIDEIDILDRSYPSNDGHSLRGLWSEFFIQMNKMYGCSRRVLVLAATNKPWELCCQMRKKFERRVYIPLPEKSARKKMFELHLSDTPSSLTEEDLEILAEYTEGYSGFDISSLIKDALMKPIRKCQAATRFIVTEEGYYMPTASSDPRGQFFTMSTLPDPTKLIPPLISLVKLNTKS